MVLRFPKALYETEIFFTGLQGDKGPPGEKGPIGLQGPDGDQGPQGLKGDDGKARAHI